MARTRNIKPSFFMHDGIAELAPLTRLLWIGLWTLADRAGRLQDNPKRIKAALFPWDAIDVDAALGELSKAGFLVRYKAGGEALLEVPNFEKHQQPHHKEKPSILPARYQPRAGTGSAPERVSELETQVAKLETQIGNLTTLSGASPPDPCSLISDHGSPVPGADKDGDPEVQVVAAFVADLPPAPGLGVLADAWNEHAHPALARVAEMNAARRKQAQAALKRRTLAEWVEVFRLVGTDPFRLGADGGWSATFDWTIRPAGVKPEPALQILESSRRQATADPEKPKSSLARMVPFGRQTEVMPWQKPQ